MHQGGIPKLLIHKAKAVRHWLLIPQTLPLETGSAAHHSLRMGDSIASTTWPLARENFSGNSARAYPKRCERDLSPCPLAKVY